MMTTVCRNCAPGRSWNGNRTSLFPGRRSWRVRKNPSRMFDPLWLLCVVAICLLASGSSSAVTVRHGFRETVIARGLDAPTAMAVAPDGRIFVTQQLGDVRIIKDGTLLPEPFATVPVIAEGEQGLIGIALDPLF